MDNSNIVLVIYVNVGSKTVSEVQEYMTRLKKEIEHKTDKFTVFFAPVRKDDTRIECINPILLDKKDYATKVSKILVDYEIRLNDFLAKPEPVKRKAKVVEKVVKETLPVKPKPELKVSPKTIKKVEPPVPQPVKTRTPRKK